MEIHIGSAVKSRLIMWVLMTVIVFALAGCNSDAKDDVHTTENSTKVENTEGAGKSTADTEKQGIAGSNASGEDAIDGSVGTGDNGNVNGESAGASGVGGGSAGTGDNGNMSGESAGASGVGDGATGDGSVGTGDNGNVSGGSNGATEAGNSGNDNIVVVLDPGHGGKFSGAEFDGRLEKKLTLTLAGYVREYLLENYSGVDVFMTREDDIELSSDLKEELELRAVFAEEKKADALVSIHFNASDKHDLHGAMVFVSRRDNVHDAGQKLGECIEEELVKLGLAREGVLTRRSNDMIDENGVAYDYYAINRHCANRDLVGVIVEHCFMDNSHDIAYIDSEEDLRKLAEADGEGIAKYFALQKR